MNVLFLVVSICYLYRKLGERTPTTHCRCFMVLNVSFQVFESKVSPSSSLRKTIVGHAPLAASSNCNSLTACLAFEYGRRCSGVSDALPAFNASNSASSLEMSLDQNLRAAVTNMNASFHATAYFICAAEICPMTCCGLAAHMLSRGT